MVKKKNKMKKLAALFSVILLLTVFMCLSAFAEGNVAKIGDTEYATVAEALSAAKSTDTVTLLQDAVYEEPKTVERKGIIDGAGHTLTLKNRINIGGSGNLTLRNITVDLSQFFESNDAKRDAFAFYSKTLTFEDGVIITGANNNLKNVVKAADAAVFNMTGGSIENCSVNNAVVCVTGNGNAKATISGGSIKNNAVPDLKGAVYLENGTLTITGNPEITGNHKKDAATLFNVNIISGTFNVEAPFTGKIGVRLNNGGALGTEIGNAGDGLTLSPDSIVRDGKPELIGYVSGGKVILNNKFILTPEIDMGKYTAADSNTYGVVRVNTTVTGMVKGTAVEKVGTYFYKTSDNGKTTANTVEINPVDFASGNGYMADVYHIDDSTATVYAVNFYKLPGIEGYIFSALEPIEYDVNAVKSVDYTEAE